MNTIHITASHANILVGLIKEDGKVIFYTTTKKLGYDNLKNTLKEAAEAIAEVITEQAIKNKIECVQIVFKGMHYNGIEVIDQIKKRGLKIKYIKDITPIPHNACRPPRKKNF